MNGLDDVKKYMNIWGWTNGGGPGSVKHDKRGKVIAHHGDQHWVCDVDNVCNTILRLQQRAHGQEEQ